MKFGLFETNNDLQRFKAFIEDGKAEGITDVELLLTKIDIEINRRFLNNRVLMSDERKRKALANKTIIKDKPINIKKECPECGSAKWYPGVDILDGEITRHYWCKNCAYGELA